MAVIALPTIRTQITGENITPLDLSTTFTLTEKLEAVRYIKASDGKVEIDYSFIDNVKSLMFQSIGTFTIEITTSVLPGPVVTVMPIEVLGMFRLDMTPAFRDNIFSITISTASILDIAVNIRAYGVAI